MGSLNPSETAHYCLSVIEPILTVLGPFFIHLFVVLFDELLYLADFPICQNASVLQNTVAVSFHEELGRARFRQLSVAGMDVHTFHNAKRGELQVVPGDLKFIIFRHLTPPCI